MPMFTALTRRTLGAPAGSLYCTLYLTFSLSLSRSHSVYMCRMVLLSSGRVINIHKTTKAKNCEHHRITARATVAADS